MPRKQVGSIDEALLAAVDERAEFLGQTRRLFIERTLRQRLASSEFKVTEGEQFLDHSPESQERWAAWRAEQAACEAKGSFTDEQADPGPVSSADTEGVRPASPAEQPREYKGHVVRSSSARPFRPAPKGKQ